MFCCLQIANKEMKEYLLVDFFFIMSVLEFFFFFLQICFGYSGLKGKSFMF